MFPKDLFRKPNIALEGALRKRTGEAYTRCPGCRGMLPDGELIANLRVCERCGAHLRVGARERIGMVADPDSFRETDADLRAGNPLGFPGYIEKADKARAESGENEAVLTGLARVDGMDAALFSMEGAFMMGSMGTAVGEKLTRLFERATELRLPVIGFTVSGGARVQEGAFSLMQMAKVTGAVKRHGDAGLPYFAVLTDPTTGGVEASFAMEADVTVAEPGALIGFAGPRVIEQTIRQKLPAGFQRAEFQLEKGFVDTICDRRALKALLARLLALHRRDSEDGQWA